ncbi:hypothetical protein FOZ63_021064, partial [Perkinsus olseni]
MANFLPSRELRRSPRFTPSTSAEHQVLPGQPQSAVPANNPVNNVTLLSIRGVNDPAMLATGVIDGTMALPTGAAAQTAQLLPGDTGTVQVDAANHADSASQDPSDQVAASRSRTTPEPQPVNELSLLDLPMTTPPKTHSGDDSVCPSISPKLPTVPLATVSDNIKSVGTSLCSHGGNLPQQTPEYSAVSGGTNDLGANGGTRKNPYGLITSPQVELNGPGLDQESYNHTKAPAVNTITFADNGGLPSVHAIAADPRGRSSQQQAAHGQAAYVPGYLAIPNSDGGTPQLSHRPQPYGAPLTMIASDANPADLSGTARAASAGDGDGDLSYSPPRHVDVNDSSLDEDGNLPPSHLAALAHGPGCELSAVTPADAIQIEPTRSGRYAVDFQSEKLELLGGSGWGPTVARARRSTNRKTPTELRLIRDAFLKLTSSGYVSTMTLRSLSRPPSPQAISHLYRNNSLIKDTHLSQGDWLRRHHPVFSPSQFVIKTSSQSTPCRIVYDCREVNKALVKPNSTRWDLLHYLTFVCTQPVVADLAKAFNQVLLTSRSSGLCCTILKCPDTGHYILVVWCAMPFGASPSPGGLELSTACIALESRDLHTRLVPSFATTDLDGFAPRTLPDIYKAPDFDYARPVLVAAFSDSPDILGALSSTIPRDLGWRDYVDDWSWGLHHVRQLLWSKSISTGVAEFRGFTYADGKENESWQEDVDAPLLGYRLRDDRLCTTIDVPDLCCGATKRDLSKCLASHYDPLGRHIELSMYARAIWRKVVIAANAPGVTVDESWHRSVPTELINEANAWLQMARTAAPTPRYIPVHSGPFCDTPCRIIISCDASGVAWATDTRTRLSGLPLSPRLRARGGMFPVARRASTSVNTMEATIPRKELHALVQGAAEALYLCTTLSLDIHHNVEIYILSDNLINIQRLSWLSSRSREEAALHIGKKGKHRFSEGDLTRLIRIRDYLLRCVVPVTVLHVPSALNLADSASRCIPTSPTKSQLRLLELLLDRPSDKPRYVPPTATESFDNDPSAASSSWYQDETVDLFETADSALLSVATTQVQARPGPMPPPFRQDDRLPVMTREEEAGIDVELQKLVEQDAFYGAIAAFLRDGT